MGLPRGWTAVVCACALAGCRHDAAADASAGATASATPVNTGTSLVDLQGNVIERPDPNDYDTGPDPDSGVIPAQTRLCVEAVAISPLDVNEGCWDLDVGCRSTLDKADVDAGFDAAARSQEPRARLAALVDDFPLKKGQAPDPWAVVKRVRGRAPALISTSARLDATHAYWPAGEENCALIDGSDLRRGIELTILDEDLSRWVGTPDRGVQERRGQVVGRLQFYALPSEAAASGQWWHVDRRHRFAVRLKVEARGEQELGYVHPPSGCVNGKPIPYSPEFPDAAHRHQVDGSNGCSDRRLDEASLYTQFADACVAHDVCFETLDQTQTECDDEFLDDLLRGCRRWKSLEFIDREACDAWAARYQGAGASFGAQSFERRQARARTYERYVEVVAERRVNAEQRFWRRAGACRGAL